MQPSSLDSAMNHRPHSTNSSSDKPQRRTTGRSAWHGKKTTDRKPIAPSSNQPDFSHHKSEVIADPEFAPGYADTATAATDGLLPGIKPVLELLQAHPQKVDTVYLRKGRHCNGMATILDLCRVHKVKFSLVEPASFSRLYAGQSQGVLARLYEAGFVAVEDIFSSVMDAPLPLVVVLDQVKDPGNAGTLARTLYALGGAGLVLPKNNGVYLGGHAAKAAAGALQLLPVARAGSLSQMLDSAKKQGFTLYGAAMAPNPSPGFSDAIPGDSGKTPARAEQTMPKQVSIYSLVPRLPAILLLGSEDEGLRPGLASRCHELVHIPMQRAFDSINVAQAGAICIAAFLQYHLSRTR